MIFTEKRVRAIAKDAIDPDETDDVYLWGVHVIKKCPPIIERIRQLEKSLGMLMDYLGVEIHEEPQKTMCRKNPHNRRTP